MSVRIQVIITDDEYAAIKEKINRENISLSQYVRSCLFPINNKLIEKERTEFEKLWEVYKQLLVEYPVDTPFNVSQILSDTKWKSLDRSTKLSLARLLNRNVKSGNLPNVVNIGRRSGNVTYYKKIRIDG